MSILATRVRALGRTCVFLSALCAAAAIAQAPVQPPASPKPAEAAGPAGPAAAAIAAQGPQPPDGVWLKDPDGREYFVDSLAKSAGVYRRVDDKTIRTVWGVTLHLEREDEQSFYFRVYRQTEADTPVMIKQQEPSADQLDAAAKTYQQAVESHLWQVSPFGAGLPASGQWRHGFAVADMNGDGFLDIVHATPRKALTSPYIFLGDGKGHWHRWAEAKYPDLAYDYGDVAVADFNRDGHLDMVLGVHLHGLIVLLGDGKGNFTDWSKGLDFRVPKAGLEPGFTSRAVAAADWNGDGRPDIIALGEGPRLNLDRGQAAADNSNGIVIYLNQGNGSWVRKDQGTGNDQLFGDTVEVADVNGDGKLDIVTPSNSYGRKDIVTYGKKDGSWQAVNVPAVRPATYVRGIAIADFDEDGRKDVAIGFINRELGVWRSGVDVLLGQADGAWRRVSVWSVEGRVSVTALAAGDLDGDHHADLIALSGKGDTWAFRGDGKGAFTREAVEIPPLKDCQGYHAEISDLNGDGRGELVESFAGEGSPMLSPGQCPSGGAIQAWQFGLRPQP